MRLRWANSISTRLRSRQDRSKASVLGSPHATSRRPDALFVYQDSFFGSRRVQLVQLITYHRLPAIYTLRDFPEVGGLMSYGSNIVDAYHQIGIYAARMLKNTKVADLPVVQSIKLVLVINAQIARMFGLTIPPTLLARADEVIE